jgi:hypothetical protein
MQESNTAHSVTERTMDTDRLRIELTKEQQDQIKDASGQEVNGIELDLRELEQRVVPAVFFKYDLKQAFIS